MLSYLFPNRKNISTYFMVTCLGVTKYKRSNSDSDSSPALLDFISILGNVYMGVTLIVRYQHKNPLVVLLI